MDPLREKQFFNTPKDSMGLFLRMDKVDQGRLLACWDQRRSWNLSSQEKESQRKSKTYMESSREQSVIYLNILMMR